MASEDSSFYCFSLAQQCERLEKGLEGDRATVLMLSHAEAILRVIERCFLEIDFASIALYLSTSPHAPPPP